MGELEEAIYLHILNQTLVDNTILITNQGLSEAYQVPIAVVERIVQGLIDGGYLLKLREGFYSVRFNRLDEIK